MALIALLRAKVLAAVAQCLQTSMDLVKPDVLHISLELCVTNKSLNSKHLGANYNPGGKFLRLLYVERSITSGPYVGDGETISDEESTGMFESEVSFFDISAGALLSGALDDLISNGVNPGDATHDLAPFLDARSEFACWLFSVVGDDTETGEPLINVDEPVIFTIPWREERHFKRA